MLIRTRLAFVGSVLLLFWLTAAGDAAGDNVGPDSDAKKNTNSRDI